MNKRQRLITGAVGLAAMAGLGLLGATVARAGGNGGGSDDDPALNGSVSAPPTRRAAPRPMPPKRPRRPPSRHWPRSRRTRPRSRHSPAVPGTAAQPELENENGSVVYGVEVTKADGTVVDVKVDAGNGEVLAREADGPDGEGHEDGDGPESADG